MLESQPVKLHFKDSGEWYSLPEWAEYFIRIGKHLVAAPPTGSRIVTAIVVPTRAFGAAFISLGCVISNAAERDRPSESAHFKHLFDMPPGTPVIFRPKPGEVFKGILQGPAAKEGNFYVRVQLESKAGGGLTRYVDESRSLQVQPASHSGKLPMKQSGSNVRFANKFVEGLLGDADPVQLGLRSKYVCAIVGRKNMLEHEIRRTPLAIHVNGHSYAEGHLQDILRVDQFVSERQTHRSALVPVGGKLPSDELIGNVSVGCVFDGAPGFLKWGKMWEKCHQVIILDRTEPYFNDAINAINTKFSQNRIEGEVPLPDCEAPAGGEVLIFREAVE